VAGARKLVIEILGNAKDASAAFADVRKDSDKTDERLSSFGTNALAAGAAIAAGLAFAVAEFVEADKASQKLDNSARNAASSAKINAAALRDVAQATQSKTAADGDSLIAGQAMLVQFGATQEQTVALTPLLADLSRKMGVDTETAARAVGKSLEGSTGQLSRMGIQVDAAKAATDPFTATMDALRSSVGGFAEAEGATAAGTLERIKNQLGDVVEAVGGGAMDAFTPLIEFMGTVGLSGSAAGDAIGNMAGKLGVIAGTTALAMGGLIKAREGIDAVKTAASGASGGIGAMGFALGAIGVVGAGLALVGIVQSINEATKSAEDFEAAMLSFDGASGVTAQINALNAMIESQTGLGDEAWDFIFTGSVKTGTLAVQLGETTMQVDGLGRALGGIKDKGDTAQLAAAIDLIRANATGSEAQMSALNAMLAPYEQTVANADTATRGHASALQDDANAAVIASEKITEYVDTLKAQTDPVFAAMRATTQNADAKDKAAAAEFNLAVMTQQGKQGSAEYTKAQQDLARAQLDSTSSAVNQQSALATLAQKMTDGTISGTYFKATLDQMVASGAISRSTADAMATSFGQVSTKANDGSWSVAYLKGTADKLNGTNANVSVSANTSDAQRKIDSLNQSITWLKENASSATSFYSILALAAGGRATGGTVHAGQPYLVGERGPEIVVPGSGYVIPTRRLVDQPSGSSSSGGGAGVIVNVTAGVGDPVAIGRSVVEVLKAYERTSGTAWRN
jgi:hypothetical protein